MELMSHQRGGRLGPLWLGRALARTPEVDHANRDQKKAKIEAEGRQDHGSFEEDCDLRHKRSMSVRVAA